MIFNCAIVDRVIIILTCGGSLAEEVAGHCIQEGWIGAPAKSNESLSPDQDFWNNYSNYYLDHIKTLRLGFENLSRLSLRPTHTFVFNCVTCNVQAPVALVLPDIFSIQNESWYRKIIINGLQTALTWIIFKIVSSIIAIHLPCLRKTVHSEARNPQ